jgi:hypothetical protein
MTNLDQTNVSQDQTHLAIHQTYPESSLSPITSVQKQQSFEATTAVLNTNELLHLIIEQIPLKYRCSLHSVSKTWRAAVTKVGYTLDPIGYDPHLPGQYLDYLPMVASELADDSLETHPETYRTLLSQPGMWLWEHSLGGQIINGHEPEQRHEFIAKPPLTQVLIWSNARELESATMRVPRGIRMGHLMDCARKIIQDDEPLVCVRWAVGSTCHHEEA